MSSTDSVAARSFHGREAELSLVSEALRSAPVVLLLGPGGAGKTRLARELVARSRESGAPFCDLSSATNAADVIATLAGVLGLAVGAADLEAAVEQVRAALGARSGLLVLDNLEGIDGAAQLIARLTGCGPRLLCTSRTRLGVEGERVVEIGPLAEADALSLFKERARLVAPELVADASTLALVQKLEGSPLAIELAAARAHVIPPPVLLERMAQWLDVLKSSASTLPPRHRSLRAVVTGSWELCSEADRRALQMASVFRGGFDLEAAEAVLGDDAADALESLLATSLLYRVAGSAGARFALYDTVRELAAERVREQPELLELARRRHAAHFHALAERYAERARNAEKVALDILSQDADNLLAAFRFAPESALAHGALFHRALPADLHLAELERARARLAEEDLDSRAEIEVAVAKAIRRFGKVERSVEQASRAVAAATAAGRDRLLAEAQYMFGVTLYDAGRLPEAREQCERAIALAEACGAPATAARALDQLGFCALDEGDFALATRCAERVIAIAREHGFRMVESFAENLLSGVHRRRGELDLAETHLRRGVALIEEVKHPPQQTILLGNLGKVLLLAGDLDAATETLDRALSLSRTWGQRKTEVAHLVNLATVFADAGLLADARARATHAEALSREVQHRRIALQAALLLGTLALIERRAADAEGDFSRALEVAGELASAPGRATANAGRAAALALGGHLEDAERHLVLAGAEAPLTEIDRAMLETGRAIVGACRSRKAAAAGDASAAAAAREESSRALAETEARAASSAELRLLRRAVLAAQTDRARTATASRAPAPTSARFELVTRGQALAGDALPADADLAFDAIERTAVIDGTTRIDLRKKPVAARLLEVVLAEPTASFDKARLYREVWHGEFRDVSQGAAVYKAVDRLARLLDADARRFLLWNEEGCLVLAARRPALLRSRGTDDL